MATTAAPTATTSTTTSPAKIARAMSLSGSPRSGMVRKTAAALNNSNNNNNNNNNHIGSRNSMNSPTAASAVTAPSGNMSNNNRRNHYFHKNRGMVLHQQREIQQRQREKEEQEQRARQEQIQQNNTVSTSNAATNTTINTTTTTATARSRAPTSSPTGARRALVQTMQSFRGNGGPTRATTPTKTAKAMVYAPPHKTGETTAATSAVVGETTVATAAVAVETIATTAITTEINTTESAAVTPPPKQKQQQEENVARESSQDDDEDNLQNILPQQYQISGIVTPDASPRKDQQEPQEQHPPPPPHQNSIQNNNTTSNNNNMTINNNNMPVPPQVLQQQGQVLRQGHLVPTMSAPSLSDPTMSELSDNDVFSALSSLLTGSNLENQTAQSSHYLNQHDETDKQRIANRHHNHNSRSNNNKSNRAVPPHPPSAPMTKSLLNSHNDDNDLSVESFTAPFSTTQSQHSANGSVMSGTTASASQTTTSASAAAFIHKSSGLAWRKPGEELRQDMIQQDNQAKHHTHIRQDCSIYKYYQVADQVLEQFLQHSIEERDELLQAYLVGMRLHHFLKDLLPQHYQYKNCQGQQDLIESRRRAQGHLKELTGYLEEISLLIDRQEHEMYISKVVLGQQSTASRSTDSGDDVIDNGNRSDDRNDNRNSSDKHPTVTKSSSTLQKSQPLQRTQQLKQEQDDAFPAASRSRSRSVSVNYSYSPDDTSDEDDEDKSTFQFISATTEEEDRQLLLLPTKSDIDYGAVDKKNQGNSRLKNRGRDDQPQAPSRPVVSAVMRQQQRNSRSSNHHRFPVEWNTDLNNSFATSGSGTTSSSNLKDRNNITIQTSNTKSNNGNSSKQPLRSPQDAAHKTRMQRYERQQHELHVKSPKQQQRQLNDNTEERRQDSSLNKKMPLSSVREGNQVRPVFLDETPRQPLQFNPHKLHPFQPDRSSSPTTPPPTNTITATTASSSSLGSSSNSQGNIRKSKPPAVGGHYVSSSSSMSDGEEDLPHRSIFQMTSTTPTSVKEDEPSFFGASNQPEDVLERVTLMNHQKKKNYVSSSMLESPSSDSSESSASRTQKSEEQQQLKEKDLDPDTKMMLMTTLMNASREDQDSDSGALLVAGVHGKSSMELPEEEAIWNAPGMIAVNAARHKVYVPQRTSRLCPATPQGLKALVSPTSAARQQQQQQTFRSMVIPDDCFQSGDLGKLSSPSTPCNIIDADDETASRASTAVSSMLYSNSKLNQQPQKGQTLRLADTDDDGDALQVEVIPNSRYNKKGGRLRQFRSCVKFLLDE